EKCMASGALPASIDATAAMRALGAGILGVAVMQVSDRLAPGEDADKMAANVLELTLAGLKSCTILQPITSPTCPFGEESAAGEVEVH
ncbi:MAG TPA: hypothetical protein VMS04_05695, partial [Vicinamibacterales bacterium]|nr:hypothetical protein [Vicinamibacterales bacterium]